MITPPSTTTVGRSEPTVDPMFAAAVRAALRRHGRDSWRLRPAAPWCHVRQDGYRSPVQGWKLHVSATPLSAPVVLTRAADVLVRHGCAFKFAATLGDVERLVSARQDRGGGGKFITAYPSGDVEDLRRLAQELHETTEGLPGPGILSDRRYLPGSLVHYRFGAFTGLTVLGMDGAYDAMLVDPSGGLVRDQRLAHFVAPAWVPRDPFTSDAAGSGAVAGSGAQVVLHDRYVVHRAVRHAYKGGVFRATDTRTGHAAVVKQARAHVGSLLTGGDVRDLLRHEANMLRLLQDTGRTPRFVELFEQQDDLFLVQEEIPGTTLRRWVQQAMTFDGHHWGPPADEVARLADELIELVGLIHARGLVLRDLTPNNVMVEPGGGLRLIDLELLAEPGARVARAFTAGYAAPEQVAAAVHGPACGPEADLYAVGATLMYLVSGAEPRHAPDSPDAPHGRNTERLADHLALIGRHNETARRYTAAILSLVDPEPALRPPLPVLREQLRGAGHAAVAPRPARVDQDRIITDSVGYLLDTMQPDDGARLWPAATAAAGSDPGNVQYGAAGVVAVLTRRYENDPSPALRDALSVASRWICGAVAREPRMLPGLYFGRSGTAWTLLDAATALGDHRLAQHARDLALRTPLRSPNPDVCHGVAGAGLTQLHFWRVTREPEFLTRAVIAADILTAGTDARAEQIVWPIPRDFASVLAGVTHYGFAHGTAGIGSFLLAVGQETGDGRYLDLAVSAAGTLTAAAEGDGDAAYWPSGAGGAPLVHWCSGSSGVGTFLLRAWRQTGDEELLTLVRRAAVAVHRSRWQSGISQCHGLAGDGDYLLDLADELGEDTYRGMAQDLADAMCARQVLRGGRMVLPDETGTEVSAGYGTGLAGSLAFLHRLSRGGPRFWQP
ncbi:class IV lanthionine synthetase LanL [Micromonospora auratinigra]|uniref:non-specific serine/threonine protein kinase n=1 Tax=Micromonospora auratinigra TaxID=261654 RepID=A0A1A8Z4Q7_9ACTN|nr:class IV lanthionine synthetase LanL [Micromonospora auratinigra]SBT38836.1 Protein kinase domain-containing protein [Micromonospora auratinigra]